MTCVLSYWARTALIFTANPTRLLAAEMYFYIAINSRKIISMLNFNNNRKFLAKYCIQLYSLFLISAALDATAAPLPVLYSDLNSTNAADFPGVLFYESGSRNNIEQYGMALSRYYITVPEGGSVSIQSIKIRGSGDDMAGGNPASVLSILTGYAFSSHSES